MLSVDLGVLLGLALVVRSEESGTRRSIARSNFFGFVERPICDEYYRAKYGNDYLREPNEILGYYDTLAMNRASDPSEFMSVDESSGEFLTGGGGGGGGVGRGGFEEFDSEEFLRHDSREDRQAPFIDPNRWKLRKSGGAPGLRERPRRRPRRPPFEGGGPALGTSRLNGTRTARTDSKPGPGKAPRRGKSKLAAGKTKRDPSPDRGRLTPKRVSPARNNGRNATTGQTAPRSSLGWANLACDPTRRIVGGWLPESIEKLPYMVFIDTGCGGAIIGSRWILTAGHCIAEEPPTYVYAGSSGLLRGCQYAIAAVHAHPHFSQYELRSDIGLVEVAPSFSWSPAIKPVALTKTRARFRMCGVVAGWGALTHRGEASMQLLVTHIPIVAKKKCHKFQLKKGEFCAGFSDGRADSCQGDSGGGFVVEDRLVGIVSYGDGCAQPRSPGVYVDVFHYLNWIKRTTGVS